MFHKQPVRIELVLMIIIPFLPPIRVVVIEVDPTPFSFYRLFLIVPCIDLAIALYLF